MKRLAKILLACALVVGATATAAAEDVLKLAVPQRGAWDAGIPELGQRGGIFARHGLKLEILYTSAGPESIQALIAGGVDLATASGVSAAFGTFAKGAPIRIIGSEIIGAPDLYWYVPSASPIKKVEDFNGKTVAFSLTGSSSHAGLLALIAQYHLTAKPTSTGSISATVTQTMTGNPSPPRSRSRLCRTSHSPRWCSDCPVSSRRSSSRARTTTSMRTRPSWPGRDSRLGWR
jgi:NitT/TauT family transport system substrate-binding protein